MSPESPLFSPLRLRDVTLPNRIGVPPMWQYVGENGFPTQWHLVHLSRMAMGGAGLVIQECTSVERRGCGTTGDLGIWDDRFIEPMSRIADTISGLGAVAGIQIGHSGRKGRQRPPWEGKKPQPRSDDIGDWDDWELIAPGDDALGPEYDRPRVMTGADIDRVIDAFGAAARRAAQAGYKLVEIHAGHGYLIHQFLSPGSNRREDRWGGDFDGRVRFLEEVVRAVRRNWPDGYPLWVRLSCQDGKGWTLDDTVRLVRRLQPLGVDLIDCSSGGIDGQPSQTSGRPDYGYQVPLADHVRRETGVPTAAVGLIVEPHHAERILSEQRADMVLLGREHLYNPNWSMDAARKLGVDANYARLPSNVGFFLKKRDEAIDGFRPSTFST